MLFAVCDVSSVEIEGSTAELRELSRKIKDCVDFCQISLSAPTDRDDRGLAYLTQLVIIAGSGAISISVSDRRLSVSGAKDKLDLFSESVDWLVDPQNAATTQKDRDHLHVEFYPGHFFLSEDALPLVLIRHD
jgi:hypothetical protein